MEMNHIRVMIADDNEDSLEILQYFINQLSDFEVVGTCKNGDELIDEVMKNKPNLLLADINMPKKNGVQAIKECLGFYSKLKFIFITGYDEYAVEAYEIEATDYIVKPIEKHRLYKALEKAKKTIMYERNNSNGVQIKMLSIKNQNGTSYIPQAEIYFVEKDGKKCLVYTKDRIFETSENISKLAGKLEDFFLPAHRSYIINLKLISHIVPQNETYLAYFYDFNRQASISKLKINEVKAKMEEYLL
jgi:two-component system, LytTR family, response regulator